MIIKNKKRIFCAKLENHFKWFLDDTQVKECESYKYLGVTIKSNGSFSKHVDIVKEKAQKSYYSLLAKSRHWGGFQPRLYLYLFDYIYGVQLSGQNLICYTFMAENMPLGLNLLQALMLFIQN